MAQRTLRLCDASILVLALERLASGTSICSGDSGTTATAGVAANTGRCLHCCGSWRCSAAATVTATAAYMLLYNICV
eukprot:7796-Heterococcus_DN1.PRE.2